MPRLQALHPKRSPIENGAGLTDVKLAIASGKGGTGKTTVATNLAVTLARHGQTVAYVDCDVEVPNGHLFLKPNLAHESPVARPVPRVDEEQCLHCGACAQICRFNAIVCLPERTLVYDELCHSCGGCALVCPVGAITEKSHPMGVVKTGIAGQVQFVSGTLNVGEAASPPVIRATKQAAPPADWTILDAPPGTACSMIETARDCDYVVLVTEPTPFGLHDLRLALQVANILKLSCGVVVNRVQPLMTETRDLCERARAPILAEIPDDLAIATAYSRGELAVEAVPPLQRTFDQLLLRLLAPVQTQVLPSHARHDLERAIHVSNGAPVSASRGGASRRSADASAARSRSTGDSRFALPKPTPTSDASSMCEVVVLSGKGGTGKTSLTASLAALAERPVLADCDVDASNLPLLLDPRVRRREPFSGGLRATIEPGLCTACGKCEELCRFDAILFDGPGNRCVPRTFRVDPFACEGCGVCAHFCAERAIEMTPSDGGEWFVSEARFGPLVHARLRPGQGNSGKLAALVREAARAAARAAGRQLVLIDGPPGVGCPVMASLTGAALLLAVTEPTPSGEHDLERVLALARQFEIPASVCVNKHDLNAAMTTRIERRAAELGATVAGRIPYDPAVTAAQRQGVPVVEHDQGPAAQAIIQLWKNFSVKSTNPVCDHSQPVSAR